MKNKFIDGSENNMKLFFASGIQGYMETNNNNRKNRSSK